MATRTLYLIRHAAYQAANAPGEEVDGPITATGKAQLEYLGQRLQYLPVSVIYHSPSMRTVQSAQELAIFFPKAVLQPSRNLRECVPALPALDTDHFKDLSPGMITAGAEQAQRAYDVFFQQAAGSDEIHLLVTHGNLIRWLICRLLGAPLEAWAHMEIQQAAFSQVVINNGRNQNKLICHNDQGHLPLTLRV